ncbi:MAG: S-methyl-5-thioribose-1-phosphate isomerase [Ignavibacteriae bacterium]|nr:S-methyl-5-thioribose-1-phosphate isomerase [Ignavibacteriota bacterium]
MMTNSFNSIEFKNNKLVLLDQTKLPLKETYIKTDDYERIAIAIERLEVRGAPAIGISAAYAIALSFKNITIVQKNHFEIVYERLWKTRPTAVNLFWALNRMKKVFELNKNSKNIYNILVSEAIQIHNEDVIMCDQIAANGLQIFKKKSTVLTHCNTGKLATGGGGTAFNVINYGFKKGKVKFVHADETRPLLQGSRLTAFELSKSGIPFSINTDSTAAFLMQNNKIDLVITGADRIALNGDSANKIGTYNLAVLCKHHNIPFYIAAPTSTIDQKCKSGKNIQIEFRDKKEINSFKREKITSEEYEVFSPAFDVTPNYLITGIITEKKLHLPPYNFRIL